MKNTLPDLLNKLVSSVDNQHLNIKNWSTTLLVTKLTKVIEKFETYKLEVNTKQNSVPVGAIFAFPVDDNIDGYLKCDGSLYSKSAYPQLAKMLNTFTTSYPNEFNVPDFRGQYLRGADDHATHHIEVAGAVDGVTGQSTSESCNPGTKLGDMFGMHLHTAEAVPHSHGVVQQEHFHNYTDSSDSNTSTLSKTGGWGSSETQVEALNNNITVIKPTTFATVPLKVEPSALLIDIGKTGGTETRPKSVLVNYYIKHD